MQRLVGVGPPSRFPDPPPDRPFVSATAIAGARASNLFAVDPWNLDGDPLVLAELLADPKRISGGRNIAEGWPIRLRAAK
jgi:hypothetical protein